MNPATLVRYQSIQSVWENSPDTLVVTQAAVWERLAEQLSSDDNLLLFVSSLDEFTLAGQVSHLPPPRKVIGLGGGTAIDAAKYVAWQKEASLILIPTALTADAPFTEAIAIRQQGHIHYMGKIYPEQIVIDIDLIRSAPPALNRGGVGDLLSIHTALYDWQIAYAYTGENYVPEVAERSARLLKRLEASADEIRRVTEAGIRLMVELFCEEVFLCHQVGSSRPEEGSEHHVLYNLEYRTGKTYLHGPAVTLCAILMAFLQNNEPARLKDLADACGVDYSPTSLGIRRDQLSDTLLTAREYEVSDGLPFTCLQAIHLNPAMVENALRWLGL